VIERLSDALIALQDRLFESLIEPVLYAAGMMDWAEQVYDALGFVMIGSIELLVLAILLMPLERLFPAEPWSDRRATRVDLLYTLLHRLGVVPLLIFALIAPLQARLDEWLLGQGIVVRNLEQWLPFLAGRPFATFLLYLVILDLAEYWFHRAQHRFAWWWSLHSLHHSQRQMSLWTEDRNHLLDDVLVALRLALVGLLVGVTPEQFLAALIVIRLVQNLYHANLRIRFGTVGDRLLVSPCFHRIHHAIGLGHDGPARGCNFAALLPIWDMLFGTANFAPIYPPTGVGDQLAGARYGEGLLEQQWLGMKRLARSLGLRRAPRPAALS
jgi:sterol desaturase/sphingolipid hydroxylase (fatty acid hydroxylase superfamily)